MDTSPDVATGQKRVLVVGASGFVGTALLARLAQDPALYVVAVSRRPVVMSGSGESREGDLRDPQFCATILRDVESVYYIAGYKENLSSHTARPFDFLSGNVEPLLTFLHAAREASVQHVVYLSTTHAESAWKAGRDGYAMGKHVSELAVQSWANQTGVAVTAMRSCGIYGPGDNFDPKTANFIPALIRRIDESESEVVVWGTGRREMQFIYIDDLVENLVAASASSVTLCSVGGDESASVDAIVSKIIEVSGKSLALQHDPTKPDAPSELFQFDNIVPPRTSLSQGLEATYAHYRTLRTSH